MSEVSYPRLTSESILERILEIVRQPAIEHLQKEAVAAPIASVSVEKAQGLLAQIKGKTTPSGWRYFHRTLRRQPRVNELIIRLADELIRLVRRVNAPLRKVQERVDMVTQNSVAAERRVNEQLAEIDAQKSSMEALQQSMLRALTQQQDELRELRESLRMMQRHLPEPVPDFDELYMRLEAQFRGDEELVRRRLSVYLPYLEILSKEHKKLKVLDVGCGRGEWLALLKTKHYDVHGVDTNAEAVSLCQKRGYAVTHEDLFEHLKAQQREAIDVISAFHVIEHLSFPQRVQLIDESLRVLTKGGMMIIETPDPENLLVSSRSFFYDPTHQNPIPAPLLEALLTERGFDVLETRKLNPAPAKWQLETNEAPALARALNERFYGAQDYGIIARKKG